VNKTERIFEDYLISLNYKFIREVKFDWCQSINSKKLPFDFIINDNIIVEIDGIQHFKQVSNWRSPEENTVLDVYKMICAYNKNYSIIRIPQMWIYYNTNNWEEYFLKSMELCRENKLIIFPLNYLYSIHEKQLKDVDIEVKYL
jgi:very-short-patch-repair endonuclease